jgi:hypothetical protein
MVPELNLLLHIYLAAFFHHSLNLLTELPILILDEGVTYPSKSNDLLLLLLSSICVAEPHHFYAAPALGENFDAALAAPAPTLLYSQAKFLKRTKV